MQLYPPQTKIHFLVFYIGSVVTRVVKDQWKMRNAPSINDIVLRAPLIIKRQRSVSYYFYIFHYILYISLVVYSLLSRLYLLSLLCSMETLCF